MSREERQIDSGPTWHIALDLTYRAGFISSGAMSSVGDWFACDLIVPCSTMSQQLPSLGSWRPASGRKSIMPT